MRREDSAETIRFCRNYLDAKPETGFVDSDFLPSSIKSLPADLATLVNCAKGHLYAHHRRDKKLVYSRLSTHIGNSLIVYYPKGDASSSPVYGSIQYIFSVDKEVRFAVHCHRPAVVSFDPFALYPHFPAKLCSSTMTELVVVDIDWVITHFVRWPFTGDYVVVLPLYRD